MSESATGVFAVESTYLDRWVQVGIASGNVIRITFPTTPAENASSHSILERLLAYLDGEADAFDDVQIALTVPTDHRQVYDTVRALPYRSDHTIEEIVARSPALTPGEESAELVRTALAANPIPIIIPDHRVADADGPMDDAVREKLRDLEGL